MRYRNPTVGPEPRSDPPSTRMAVQWTDDVNDACATLRWTTVLLDTAIHGDDWPAMRKAAREIELAGHTLASLAQEMWN